MAEKNQALALAQKTQDGVMAKIRQFQERGELTLPANYSPENALKSAWLTIQETVDRNKKPALEVCTQNSFANALLTMVVQGLNPDKKQCYFIVYGNKLLCQRSYFGAASVAKRVNSNVLDFNPQPIYEGDNVEMEIRNGKTYITKHTRAFGDINKKAITGAYCVVEQADGDSYAVVMTMDEIKDAWKQSQMNPVTDKGDIKPGSTHEKFTGEMAGKTVINRAAKHIINMSDDGNLVASIAKQNDVDIAQAEAEAEIAENANKGAVIDAEFMEVHDDMEAPAAVDMITGEVEEPAPEPEAPPAENGPGF